jgi:hypothetical protein
MAHKQSYEFKDENKSIMIENTKLSKYNMLSTCTKLDQTTMITSKSH